MPFWASPFVDYSSYQSRSVQNAIATAAESDRLQGIENFHFPYSHYVLNNTGSRPDLVLCHNLHGDYFDLRVLSGLSRAVPTVLLPHDSWLLTGHCAQPVGCERWRTGCGSCPDLTLTPSVLADATHFNWVRKRQIFDGARISLIATTRWVQSMAQRSILAPAIQHSRVLPLPIDPCTFHPEDRRGERRRLGLPEDAFVIAFTVNQGVSYSYRDHDGLLAALGLLVPAAPGSEIIAFGIGAQAAPEEIGAVHLLWIPFQDSSGMASYLRAADVLVQPSRLESYGLVAAEALSCGTPVVSSAVGGIPEVVADGVHGLLVPPGEPRAFAHAMQRLYLDAELRERLGRAGSEHAQRHWSEDEVVPRYLEFFQEIADAHATIPDA
jgi:glycosyltransferase involved in cell wall biosynthesis